MTNAKRIEVQEAVSGMLMSELLSLQQNHLLLQKTTELVGGDAAMADCEEIGQMVVAEIDVRFPR